MSLLLEKDDLNEYLKPSEIIDFQSREIMDCANLLVRGINDEVLKIKRIYEFVRDKIHHTFDINGNEITCKASEVLKYRQGICYAKSHLLAALLRYLGIPTGFCYQKLIFSAENPIIILHGLNAVYIKQINKWLRLDSRGNKEGINAQFSTEREMLAFPVRSELGEEDGKIIYAAPNAKVISALENSKTREELIKNLPTEL
ncbi:MAG: transglutaminase domain-containing protein [Firmicutes bacterium]|nr:transglutaminase domain-containing protein [Bacillota bacterium]